MRSKNANCRRNLDVMAKLPDTPEPTEVEIEVTNYCNARCIACPREMITSPQGFMKQEVFRDILDKYQGCRERYAINKIIGRVRYPLLTFAGLGEPLLHPRIHDFISEAKKRGFETALFTNASLLNWTNSSKLVKTGLDYLYVSFWGITKNEYEESMGLDYDIVLKNIMHIAKMARSYDMNLLILWLKLPEIKSSIEQVKAFWTQRGIEVEASDVYPWNRAGYLDKTRSLNSLFKQYPSVDFSMNIWCSQLFFTDTICWDGNFVICCNDYFQRTSILGSLEYDSLEKIARKKALIIRNKSKPKLCRKCRKPTRNYVFASDPWDKILNDEEKEKYWYDE